MIATSEAPKAEEKTYGQILKSTALVGGSQVVNIAMGIIRTKAMAMLLGPAGFGLAGLYMSIANLTQSIAGMGVNSSGVRQMAEAAGTDDEERIARTAAVLRRTSVLLGALGAVFLTVFCRQVSTLTFGTTQHAGAVALLSLVVFFNLVSAGQGALIQGLRQISDLAQMAVLGGVYGTVATIPIVYFLRQRGVVPSLVAVAALMLLTSWWYSRKVRIPKRSVSMAACAQETSALLKLGFAFMASGLMMMGSAYVIRVIVVHKLGLEATGFYQCAWTLGGLYVGTILQAMVADFYPRLAATARDNLACNRVVNEQTQVSLLLTGPGVIATITFAPFVIAMFYAARFEAAVDVLRWICLGATVQVITFPIGFIIVAKGEQGWFFWTELTWTVVHISMAFAALRWFGLSGVGIAFFGSYVVHLLVIYPIVSRLSGFRWSVDNIRTALLYVFLVTVVFCGYHALPSSFAAAVGIIALAVSCIYSVNALLRLFSFSERPIRLIAIGAWRRFFVRRTEVRAREF